MTARPPLLEVRDLRVRYAGRGGPLWAVDGLSFSVEPGETYALVGESGCGKSTAALALLRLTEPGEIVGARIDFDGRNLMDLPEREMRRIRGARIGMVFQEPAAALNPVMRIGRQVSEALRVHRGLTRREAREQAVRLLTLVSLPDPERQARAWPHELSGGMMQRVMLAIALSCSPALLIADEPTSALDVTVQAEIMALLRRLKDELNLTVLLISHDMALVAENADRVGVMYAGRLVEEGPVRELTAAPQHPYTRGLLGSTPGFADPATGRRLATIAGRVPDPADLPSGCRFHPRCPERFAPCSTVEPDDIRTAPGHRVACLLYGAGRPAAPAPDAA